MPFAFSQIKTKLHLAGKPPRTKAAKTAPIASLDPHFLFSFSGIKTAVLRYVELHNLRPEAESRREALFTGPDAPATPTIEDALATCDPQTLDLIASFQHAVVGDLIKKTFAAHESLGAPRILVTGGVAANRELRARFTAEAARRNLPVAFPTLALSTDNAAMIAAAAWPRFLAGEFAPPTSPPTPPSPSAANRPAFKPTRSRGCCWPPLKPAFQGRDRTASAPSPATRQAARHRRSLAPWKRWKSRRIRHPATHLHQLRHAPGTVVRFSQ